MAAHGVASLRRAWSLLREAPGRRRSAAWRWLAASSADLIVVLDAGLVHLHASPAIHELFGCDAATLPGRPALQHVHPDDRPALAAALAALAPGAPDPAPPRRFRVRHADGRLLWVEARARRLAGGEFVLSLRDISARLQDEERGRDAASLRAVGEVAAGVAHDFNNLLTVILGNLEMLEARDGDAEGECILAARQAGARAAALTSELLSYAGLQALHPDEVDVVALLGDLQRHLQGLLPGLPVGLDLEPGLPPALIDRVQLRAALVSLTLDAARRAEPGAGLCLEAYAAHATGEDGLASGPHVVVAVTDAAWDSLLCEVAPPPPRMPMSMPGVPGLSGLGVTAARGFARRSGGDLRMTGMAGIGMRAEIWLPVCTAAARQETARQEAGKQPA